MHHVCTYIVKYLKKIVNVTLYILIEYFTMFVDGGSVCVRVCVCVSHVKITYNYHDRNAQ